MAWSLGSPRGAAISWEVGEGSTWFLWKQRPRTSWGSEDLKFVFIRFLSGKQSRPQRASSDSQSGRLSLEH